MGPQARDTQPVQLPRFVFALAALIGVSMSVASIASAETPAEVVAGTADDGVFIATGLGDEADFAPVVDRAAAAGLDMAVIEPLAPEPDAAAFALRVLQASEHDLVALVDQNGRIWLQAAEIEDRDLLSARREGEAQATTVAALNAIVDDLVTDPEPETPAIFGSLQRAALALLALVILGTIADQFVRRLMASQRRKRASAASAARLSRE